MKISKDQMQEIRTLLRTRVNLQETFNTPKLDKVGHFIETFHSEVYTSTAPLASLRCAPFRDLRLEMPNRGFYVVARVIERPYGFLNFSLAIDDEKGDIIILELVNIPSVEIPQAGQVIIIKEPYYKLTTRELPAIRCDSPTDITIIQENHSLYHEIKRIQWKNEIIEAELVDFSLNKTANEWLEEGKKLIAMKMNMTDAINCYFKGLKVCSIGEDDWMALMQKLYWLYYSEEYFELAEKCAIDIRAKVPSCTEAMVLLIQARINLHKYEEASKYSLKYFNKLKGHADFLKHVKRVYWEFKDLFTAADSAMKSAEHIDLRCHETISKYLKVNRSNYVVASTKIFRNHQLIVAHPFFILSASPNFKSFFNYLNYNEIGENWFLIREIIIKVYKNPNTYFQQIFGFRSSVSSKESPPNMYCDENSSELTIDVERIKDICRTNMFTGIRDNENDKFVALYGYPSYLKHSCNPNASYKVCNDAMFVKTLKEIRKNDLVTVDYAQFETDPQERRELLSRRSVLCDCQKCGPISSSA
ncbi:hypothetical protein CHUAL_003600 [Chamberlinius hualienensis]